MNEPMVFTGKAVPKENMTDLELRGLKAFLAEQVQEYYGSSVVVDIDEYYELALTGGHLNVMKPYMDIPNVPSEVAVYEDRQLNHFFITENHGIYAHYTVNQDELHERDIIIRLD